MLNINSIEVGKIFLGNKELNKIYLGNYLIYSKNQNPSLVELELSGRIKANNKMSNSVNIVKENFIIDIDDKKLIELKESANKTFISNLSAKKNNDNYIVEEAGANGTGFTDKYTKVHAVGMRIK